MLLEGDGEYDKARQHYEKALAQDDTNVVRPGSSLSADRPGHAQEADLVALAPLAAAIDLDGRREGRSVHVVWLALAAAWRRAAGRVSRHGLQRRRGVARARGRLRVAGTVRTQSDQRIADFPATRNRWPVSPTFSSSNRNRPSSHSSTPRRPTRWPTTRSPTDPSCARSSCRGRWTPSARGARIAAVSGVERRSASSWSVGSSQRTRLTWTVPREAQRVARSVVGAAAGARRRDRRAAHGQAARLLLFRYVAGFSEPSLTSGAEWEPSGPRVAPHPESKAIAAWLSQLGGSGR